ncbi:hypothetical protein BGZ60DRAFT_21751 [Tricladium varicosporioides]|nr:hypothetical protein BGZ60DRAFT_21751 [Hymenoscyphus varicosporioides]
MSVFVLFSSLPNHLREKVWALSLPPGRVIEPPRSSFHDPSSLRVACRESRRIYLKSYHEIEVPRYIDYYLCHILNPRKTIIKPQTPVFYDPSRDLLVFDHGIGFGLKELLEDWNILLLAHPVFFQATRQLAINYIGAHSVLDAIDLGLCDNLIRRILHYCPFLKHFIIVLGPTLPVIPRPLQIPIKKALVKSDSDWQDFKDQVLRKAQKLFADFQEKNPSVVIPEIRVLIRTTDGFWDPASNCLPWGNRGC